MNYVCLLLFSVFITLALCVCLCEYMTYMCDGEVFNVLHIGHNITLAGRGRLEYTRRFLNVDMWFVGVSSVGSDKIEAPYFLFRRISA